MRAGDDAPGTRRGGDVAHTRTPRAAIEVDIVAIIECMFSFVITRRTMRPERCTVTTTCLDKQLDIDTLNVF